MKRWRSFRMERFNGIQIAATCNSEVVSRIVVLDRNGTRAWKLIFLVLRIPTFR